MLTFISLAEIRTSGDPKKGTIQFIHGRSNINNVYNLSLSKLMILMCGCNNQLKYLTHLLFFSNLHAHIRKKKPSQLD